MVHDHIKKALEQFGATYRPHPTDPRSTIVTIPGADHGWLFGANGDVWRGNKDGKGPHLDHHRELSSHNEEVRRESEFSNRSLNSLIRSLVRGSGYYETPSYHVHVSQLAIPGNEITREPHKQIQKGYHTELTVKNGDGGYEKTFRMHSHPDYFTSSAEPLPDDIAHGVNQALQTGIMDPLVDKLIEHHDVMGAPGQYARAYAQSLRTS